MKKIIISLILAAFSVGLWAQIGPKSIGIKVEEFAYQKPSTGKSILNVLSSIATEKVYSEDESMVPQIQEAIAAAVAQNERFSIVNNQNETPDYRLEGVINSAEFAAGTKSHCLLIVTATVVDAKTNQKIATKVCKGYYMGWIDGEMSELKAKAANNLTYSLYYYLMEAIPINGSILEKGVEQANGKIKNDQCYVDLGKDDGIGKGMKLYVLVDGKYKAELKVEEILGDDMSACKITSGKSTIEKCLEKNTPMVVTSKPKKIKDD